MRLIESLFKKLSPTRRTDSVFGVMRYMGDRLLYWEGTAQFRGTSRIEVFVHGSRTDNFARQHAFFRTVVAIWDELQPDFVTVLRAKAHSRIQSHRFEIASMTIPNGTFDSAEWELSFVNKNDDRAGLFTIRMKGREILGATYDD